MYIGDPELFAFEINDDDYGSDLRDVHIIICNKRISGRGPVYVPTFTSELESFAKVHKNWGPQANLSTYTDAGVFSLLHTISQSDMTIDGVTSDMVYNYFRMHSLDDAVDDWEIYVLDDNDDKRIVCKKNSAQLSEEIIKCKISAKLFLETIDNFITYINKNCE